MGFKPILLDSKVLALYCIESHTACPAGEVTSTRSLRGSQPRLDAAARTLLCEGQRVWGGNVRWGARARNQGEIKEKLSDSSAGSVLSPTSPFPPPHSHPSPRLKEACTACPVPLEAKHDEAWSQSET